MPPQARRSSSRIAAKAPKQQQPTNRKPARARPTRKRNPPTPPVEDESTDDKSTKDETSSEDSSSEDSSSKDSSSKDSSSKDSSSKDSSSKDPSSEDSDSDDSTEGEMTEPALDLVHPALSDAWIVHPKRENCIIFDVVNPVRQFKRGTVEDLAVPFPSYDPNPEEDPNVVESDDGELPLQQYCPYLPDYWTYDWEVNLTEKTFMNWRAGEVMNIRMAKKVKKVNRRTYTKRWSTKRLPIPYARIVHQLSLEARHGDISDGHEAVRRGGYARRVLDAFGEELTAFKGVAKDFRSKVLTPILQRQLRGIPDNYAPHIRSNISNSRVIKPTIAETTAFYLGEDPIDPDFIPSYRRNLLYIREARWALWIVMGLAKVNSKEDYNRSLTAQDKIMEGLTFTRDEVEKMPGVNRDILDQVMELDTTLSLQPHYDGYESDSLPRFTYPEVRAIVFEGLEKYFAKELKEVPPKYFAFIKIERDRLNKLHQEPGPTTAGLPESTTAGPPESTTAGPPESTTTGPTEPTTAGPTEPEPRQSVASSSRHDPGEPQKRRRSSGSTRQVPDSAKRKRLDGGEETLDEIETQDDKGGQSEGTNPLEDTPENVEQVVEECNDPLANMDTTI